MTCIIGSDHAGLVLANEILVYLKTLDIENVIDILPNGDCSVDYPDYANLVCKKVLEIENSIGILICGSGLGMSISANRIKGIRATLCLNEYMAKYARLHNDANVLCLGARIVGAGLAKNIVKVFLEHTFEGGRHKIRLDKIDAL